MDHVGSTAVALSKLEVKDEIDPPDPNCGSLLLGAVLVHRGLPSAIGGRIGPTERRDRDRRNGGWGKGGPGRAHAGHRRERLSRQHRPGIEKYHRPGGGIISSPPPA